jgi:hypothetical protein
MHTQEVEERRKFFNKLSIQFRIFSLCAISIVKSLEINFLLIFQLKQKKKKTMMIFASDYDDDGGLNGRKHHHSLCNFMFFI